MEDQFGAKSAARKFLNKRRGGETRGGNKAAADCGRSISSRVD